MKNQDLQDQLNRKNRRTYYTMTYTGDEPTQVVNFTAQSNSAKKSGGKTLAKLFWLGILGVIGYYASLHFS